MYESKEFVTVNKREIPFYTIDRIKDVEEPVLHHNAVDEIFVYLVHSEVTPNVIPNRYLLSNYGRLYDCYLGKDVPVKLNEEGGYLTAKIVCFKDSYNCKALDVYIHRLVCFYFNYFPGCEMLEVNHKTGNHLCNIWYQLEWVNEKQNIHHAVENGLIKSGANHPSALLTREQADEICRLIVAGEGNTTIAAKFGISDKLVSAIRTGEAYTEIGKKYDITKYANKQVHGPLTTDQVHTACRLLLEGYTSKAVAEELGCSEQQIKDLRTGRNYTNITDMYNLDKIPTRKPANRMPDELVHEICKRIEAGKDSCRFIANDLGVSKNTVITIKNGLAYTDISKDYNMPGKERGPKPSIETIHEVCKELENTRLTANAVAVKYGVTVDCVRHLKRGDIYKDIVSQYNIPKY